MKGTQNLQLKLQLKKIQKSTTLNATEKEIEDIDRQTADLKKQLRDLGIDPKDDEDTPEGEKEETSSKNKRPREKESENEDSCESPNSQSSKKKKIKRTNKIRKRKNFDVEAKNNNIFKLDVSIKQKNFCLVNLVCIYILNKFIY